MALTRIINKFFSFLYFFVRFRNYTLAYQFANYYVPLKLAVTVRRSGGNLLFLQTGNQIPVEQSYKFKQESAALINVLNHPDIKVVGVNKDGFVVEAGGVQLNVTSLSNVVTIEEVFMEKEYGILSPDRDIVIIDIGMNVGYASLFFASLPNVSKVYSFEPFPGTYREALANIGINTAVKDKITAFNDGVSNYTGAIEVPLLETGSAVASTNDTMINFTKSSRGLDGSANVVKVTLKSIETVLNEVLAKHPNQSVFLKVDCEGEEYSIMESLNQSGIMRKISGFLIEWHLKGPAPIAKVLTDHHFIVLDRPGLEMNRGMLYAFRQNGVS